MLLLRRFFSSPASNLIRLSHPVRTALEQNQPVVALESTVITHGLPFPHNLETAQSLERIITAEQCVPATVAIFDGKINVGLTEVQLEHLAQCKSARKVSRRDLSFTLSQCEVGGTTVSATMLAAHWAGIRIFATGGIGGVHRGAEETFDVSTDLTELGRTPVAVVCAGVKSILDIPKTLQVLETQGVPVAVLGASNEFPGFFTPKTGQKAPFATDKVETMAQILETWKQTDVSNGVLIACPIPASFAAVGDDIENAIHKALLEATEAKITGQALTPFLLQRVNELTQGASLKANIGLLQNNAAQAARIARAWNSVGRRAKTAPDSPKKQAATSSGPQVTVIGAAIVDYYAQLNEAIHLDGRTQPAEMHQVCGGVGRNHADALQRLGAKTLFVSAAGNDANGAFFRQRCSHMDLSAVRAVDMATASYMAVTENGTMRFSVGAIDKVCAQITPDYIKRFEGPISKSQFALLDGNLSVEAIRAACEICHFHKVPIWYEPADLTKVSRIFQAKSWPLLTVISPNRNECAKVFENLNIPIPTEFAYYSVEALLDLLKISSEQIMQHLRLFVLTLGADGVLLLDRLQNDQVRYTYLEKPVMSHQVVCDSGAGDCFNSGLLYGLLQNHSLEKSAELALECAAHSLQAKDAVPQSLSEIGCNQEETRLRVTK